jgi:hypothetical protein
MQQPSQLTTHQPLENRIRVQHISQSSQRMMTLQQFNYPTCSTNIPQIHQQTDQYLPQQPTSKFLPIEEYPENDIKEKPDTEMETTSKQHWQVLEKRKRSKLSPDVSQVSNRFQIKTQNRYEQLIPSAVEDTLTNNINETPTNSENITINRKPPPILIYGVTNNNQMVEYLTTAVKEEQYYCKTIKWHNKSQYKHIRFI